MPSAPASRRPPVGRAARDLGGASLAVLLVIAAGAVAAPSSSTVGGRDTPGPAPASVGITSFMASPSPAEVGALANLTVATAGGSGSLEFTYTGLPAYCVSSNVSVLPCTPSTPGTYHPHVFVNDSAGAGANASLTWVVAPRLSVGPLNVTPPVADSLQGVYVALGSSGGVLPYKVNWSGLPDECVPNGSLAFPCRPGDAGFYLITGRVTDARGIWGESTALLQVIAPPNVTKLLAVPANVTLGQPVTFVALGHVGSGVPSYAYAGLPPGCSSVNASFFNCTPTASGTFLVTVIVTDQFGGTAERNAVLNVTPPELPRPQLVLFRADPSRVLLGENTTLLAVLLNGSPPWTYAYSGLPPGCPSVNRSPLVCTPNASGNYTITFTAVDGSGANVTGEAGLTVAAPAVPIPPLLPGRIFDLPTALEAAGAGLFLGLVLGVVIGRSVQRRTPPVPY